MNVLSSFVPAFQCCNLSLKAGRINGPKIYLINLHLHKCREYLIDTSNQHCAMGFLKNESLQVIVDAPKDSGIYNSFDFSVTTAQSTPVNGSGLLVKFFVAAKFDHTIPSGWPVLQIRKRIHTSDSSYPRWVFITIMEPRPTGYLNVFEYDVQNMTFDVQSDDVIRVFWPQDTNVSRRYSLAYFRDDLNVMLSIEINQNMSTTIDDSITTPEPHTTMSINEITTVPKRSTPGPKQVTTTTMSSSDNDFTTNSVSTYESQSTFTSLKVPVATPVSTNVPETSKKGQNQVSIIVGGVLCAMAAIILVVVLVIVFVVFRCRNHTKDFIPNTNDLKTSAPVVDNPTYSLVDGEFYYEFIVMVIIVHITCRHK